MTTPLQIRMRELFEFDGFELYIRTMERFPNDPDTINILINMTFEKVSSLTTRPSGAPFLLMEKPQAKQLMDDLWNAGVRPSNFVDNQGTAAAMKEHINDLRNVLNKIYERWLPG